jgi:hypothetical protein
LTALSREEKEVGALKILHESQIDVIAHYDANALAV